MAFSDFGYPEVLNRLGLRLDNSPNMFGGVADLPAGPTLRALLEVNVPLATTADTEPARAAYLVAPILGELWSRYRGHINLQMGREFAADPDAGLSGYCDFLIGRAPQQPRIVAPVVVVFEAKRDSINDNLGQCIAGAVGALRFNRREGTGIDTIYGVGTTGSQWKFLRLTDARVTLDLAEYGVNQVDRLLGILSHIVGPIPGAAAA